MSGELDEDQPISTHEVTRLLLACKSGDEAALDRLLPLVYDELHRLARRYMARAILARPSAIGPHPFSS
jgi:hypothetical protein